MSLFSKNIRDKKKNWGVETWPRRERVRRKCRQVTVKTERTNREVTWSRIDTQPGERCRVRGAWGGKLHGRGMPRGRVSVGKGIVIVSRRRGRRVRKNIFTSLIAHRTRRTQFMPGISPRDATSSISLIPIQMRIGFCRHPRGDHDGITLLRTSSACARGRRHGMLRGCWITWRHLGAAFSVSSRTPSGHVVKLLMKRRWIIRQRRRKDGRRSLTMFIQIFFHTKNWVVRMVCMRRIKGRLMKRVRHSGGTRRKIEIGWGWANGERCSPDDGLWALRWFVVVIVRDEVSRGRMTGRRFWRALRDHYTFFGRHGEWGRIQGGEGRRAKRCSSV